MQLRFLWGKTIEILNILELQTVDLNYIFQVLGEKIQQLDSIFRDLDEIGPGLGVRSGLGHFFKR